MPTAEQQQNWIHVGAINGVHGLLGHVKIKPFINEIHLLVGGAILLDEAGHSYTLQKVKIAGQKKLVFKFKEITDRTSAEKMVGTDLYLDPLTFDTSDFAPDIVGQSVRNRAGEVIGIIKNIFDNGAHEVLEIETPDGTEILLPHTELHTEINTDYIMLTADGEACLDV